MRLHYESPLPVGRERESFAFAEQRRVRAVGLAEKGLEALGSRLVVLVEEKHAAGAREVHGVGLSEPGEVGLLRRAGSEGEDVAAHVSIAADVQGHAVLRYVLQTGQPRGRAQAAVQRDSPRAPA